MTEQKKTRSFFLTLFYHALPALFFVALMWLTYFIQLINFTDYDLSNLGVWPRHKSGLYGILFSPFLHGSFDHLLSNSGPMLILGTMLVMFYRAIWFRSFVMLYLLAGLGLWMGGRDNIHIGASGIVYALAAFLITIGLLRLEIKLVAISFLVIFLYGGIVWGILPILEHVSWEGHLFGMMGGIITAFYYKNDGREKPKLYKWEMEEIDAMMEQNKIAEAEKLLNDENDFPQFKYHYRPKDE